MPSDPVTLRPCSQAIRLPTVSSIVTAAICSVVASATTVASPGFSVDWSNGDTETLTERSSSRDAARNSSRANCVRPPASISYTTSYGMVILVNRSRREALDPNLAYEKTASGERFQLACRSDYSQLASTRMHLSRI